MKNQTMWFVAIGINLILIFFLFNPFSNSNQGQSMDVRLGYLIMPFIISSINFFIAIFINIYNVVKGEKFKGHPFFLLSLLALLVGLGICSLQK
jgi:hypothetical protein